jgi:hypothetical protein
MAKERGELTDALLQIKVTETSSPEFQWAKNDLPLRVPVIATFWDDDLHRFPLDPIQ